MGRYGDVPNHFSTTVIAAISASKAVWLVPRVLAP
jgi:hypothetical protein